MPNAKLCRRCKEDQETDKFNRIEFSFPKHGCDFSPQIQRPLHGQKPPKYVQLIIRGEGKGSACVSFPVFKSCATLCVNYIRCTVIEKVMCLKIFLNSVMQKLFNYRSMY